MEVKWHSTNPVCGTCGKKATLVSAAFNAYGEVKFHYVCVACGTDESLESSVEQIICLCHDRDVKAEDEDPYERILNSIPDDSKGN